MTDLEITRLCAEAMGRENFMMEDSFPYVRTRTIWGAGKLYDPLHDDAQAMALARKFLISVNPQEDGTCEASYFGEDDEIRATAVGINRAICECVAKLKQGE